MCTESAARVSRSPRFVHLRVGPAIDCLLAARNIDPSVLRADTEIPLEVFEGDVSLPLPTARLFIDRAATVLDMPLLGLELATMSRAGALGLTEAIMRAAPTIADALRALADYAVLAEPGVSLRFDSGGHLHLSLTGERDAFGAQLNELWLAYIMRTLEAILGRPIAFERVWFSHARSVVAGYQLAQRMRCPVEFQAADCGIAIPRELLDARPLGADVLSYAYLRQQADNHLASQAQADIITHVARVIDARLGSASENEVARSMALTTRTLQRYLASAGTSFRAIRSEIRRRRRAALAAGGVNDTVIAERLGYSDARTMRRALDAA